MPRAARRCRKTRRSASAQRAITWPRAESNRSALAAWYGPPPICGGLPSTRSIDRFPTTASTTVHSQASVRAARYLADEPRERERDRKARQRRADLRIERMKRAQEVRQEAESLRLREPLVQREAAEPRADHRRAERRAVEHVLARVAHPTLDPVREQHAEQRDEERPEQVQELRVLREVERERADGRHRCAADHEGALRK